jgi:hypothetical protein
MMKRKSYGSLALRKLKTTRVAKIAIPAVNIVWGNYDLVRTYILPFLDEWTTYNLARVDRTLSEVLKDTCYKHETLSLLSQHFNTIKVCCICFGPTRSNTFCITSGLYCHSSCIPSIVEWEINDNLIPQRRMHNSLGVIIRGYEFKNPCFSNQNNTLAYYIQKIDKIVHNVQFCNNETMVDSKYIRYFKEFYKRERVNNGFNINKKVNLGGTRVSVLLVFNYLYPTFYNTHDADEVIEKYKNVEIRIKDVHDLIRIHFSTYIRPQLLDAPSWGKFFCSPCLGFVTYNTYLTAILSSGVISSPDKMIDIMKDNVLKVRLSQVKSSCTYSIDTYCNYITCQCINCKLLFHDNQFLKRIGVDCAKYLIDSGIILSHEVIRLHTWKHLERYSTHWIRIRSQIYNKIELVINHIHFGGDWDKFDAFYNTVERLILNDGHSLRDIKKVINPTVEKTYTNISSDIALLIKYRKTCHCNKIVTSDCCSKHRLCVICCYNKDCTIELCELHSSESESESDNDIVYISD